MKRLIFLALLVALPALAATTYTTNYNLGKPADGDTNYGQIIRDNADTIDTTMKANADSTTDHVNDTSGAHAATAISATSGANICTTSTNVQAYLDCLDGVFDPSTSGVVLTTGNQSIAGIKTFTSPIVLSSIPTAPILATDGTGALQSTTFDIIDPLTTKGDFTVHNGSTSTRLAVGSDGQFLVADSAQAEGVDWVDQNPRWRKFTYSYTDFSAAATTFGVIAFQLAVGEGFDASIVKHNTAFTGGTLTGYTVEVGITGDTDTIADTFDIFQATSDTLRKLTNTLDVPNFGSTTDVIVTVNSAGGNLDQATAGSVDIYVRTFTLP